MKSFPIAGLFLMFLVPGCLEDPYSEEDYSDTGYTAPLPPDCTLESAWLVSGVFSSSGSSFSLEVRASNAAGCEPALDVVCDAYLYKDGAYFAQTSVSYGTIQSGCSVTGVAKFTTNTLSLHCDGGMYILSWFDGYGYYYEKTIEGGPMYKRSTDTAAAVTRVAAK